MIFLQKDYNSLQKYLAGRNVTVDDIKRGLLVKQHTDNAEIPDHFYKLYNKDALGKADSIVALFISAIPDFVEDFLVMDYENRITVKEEKFIDWQNTIADFSPLFLQASYLYKFGRLHGTSVDEILAFHTEYIHSNAAYTALVSPDIKPIHNLFKSKGSFYDLHIHLNGVTESDAVWQNLLNEIDKNVKNIGRNLHKENFLQQTEQIGIQVTETLMSDMLREARKIRWDFFDAVFKSSQSTMVKNASDAYYNPFMLIFDGLPDAKIPNKQLEYEMLMYILVLHYLERTGDSVIANKLHKYLLIYGFFEELIVQDCKKFGFEQFQRMTNNDVRSTCDDYQLSKFLQLAGNHLNNVQFVCFRFSPQTSADSQMKLLRKIDNDWQRFKEDYASVIAGESISQKMEYRLIAHFIKKPDSKPKEYVRFSDLRKELSKKGRVLKSIMSGKSEFSKKIVAVDAAANELDAPPEVFAPLFRDLKKEKLIHHVTYHAGEDFYHILSGLRAIYEAMYFLDMKHGDRIGHAAAAGTDVKTWADIVGNELYMPQGIYMDDLIFAYHFINDEKIECLYHALPFLTQKIERLFLGIYKKHFPVSLLVGAWENRWYNPELLCDTQKKTLSGVAWNNTFTEIPDQEFEILSMYNESKYREIYDKPCWIKIDEFFSADELVLLQQKLLAYMHRKEIIIEALPTSNLRIGYHRSLKSHQLFKWYEWKKDEHPIPPIVLGTDDPGVFETNIYNEYALVYCYLVYEKEMPREDVMKYIYDIYTNSQIYAFRD